MKSLRGRLKKWSPFLYSINYTDGHLALEGLASSKAALALRFNNLHGHMDKLDLRGFGFRMGAQLRGIKARNSCFDQAVFGPTDGYHMQDEALNSDRNFTPPRKGIDTANLEASDLAGSSFRNAVLTKVIGRNAKFDGCDLTNADMRDSDFSGASFAGADFTGVRIDARTLFSPGALDDVRNLERAVVVDARGRTIETARMTPQGILYPLRGQQPSPTMNPGSF